MLGAAAEAGDRGVCRRGADLIEPALLGFPAVRNQDDFQYHAPFEDRGSERELCAVYLGRTDGPVHANETEIADWCWIDVAEFERQLAEEPDRYTPWLKLEWAQMREQYWATVSRYIGSPSAVDP